ncbi:MAG: hypothetical protein AB4080_20240 [Trichodesmium sp.]
MVTFDTKAQQFSFLLLSRCILFRANCSRSYRAAYFQHLVEVIETLHGKLLQNQCVSL